VPLPLSVSVTPVGSAPVLLISGAGEPVVVTVNVPALLSVNVALFALVIAGAAIGTQDENLNEPTRVCQLNVPFVVRYSVVYQKVQSSTGSTTMEL
jgi:hypothetical protein